MYTRHTVSTNILRHGACDNRSLQPFATYVYVQDMKIIKFMSELMWPVICHVTTLIVLYREAEEVVDALLRECATAKEMAMSSKPAVPVE